MSGKYDWAQMFADIAGLWQRHRIDIAIQSRHQQDTEYQHRPRCIVKPLKTRLCIQIGKHIVRLSHQFDDRLELSVGLQSRSLTLQSRHYFSKVRWAPGNQQLTTYQTENDRDSFVHLEQIGRDRCHLDLP